MVNVIWLDAASDDGSWKTESEIDDINAPRAESIGYVWSIDEKQIKIIGDKVNEHGDAPYYGRTTVIPLGMVERINILTVDEGYHAC